MIKQIESVDSTEDSDSELSGIENEDGFFDDNGYFILWEYFENFSK